MADTKEMVVCRTIIDIASIVSLRLPENVSIFEIMKMTPPFIQTSRSDRPWWP